MIIYKVVLSYKNAHANSVLAEECDVANSCKRRKLFLSIRRKYL